MPTLQAIVMVISLAVSGSADAVEGRVVDAATGAPVAGAEVTVVGERRAVRTDKNGRFHWSVAPSLPATVVIVLADGRVGRPIQLTAIDTAAELTLAVDAALRESVDVLGAAPTIDASPAAAASLLAVGDLELRHPPTLTQALDGVPGVSPVSEGQAAVPAIRGLARGRTLILVDGGRATAERRAGASASFLDPASIRTIEVARGPGSVAYGSDAFGGVIAARTRGPHYDRAVRVRFAGTGGWGVPEASGELEIAKGHESGGVLVAIRARDLGDYDAPRGVVPNSGWRDRGMRARWEQLTETGLFSIAWQSDFGRDLGRPRSDSDLILATSPFDDSHRLTVSYEHRGIGGLRNLRIDGLAGASRQRTDQDRLPMSSRPRSIERADLSSRDLQVRVTGERILGPARVHVGADVQGRYGLEALDATLAYDLGGTLASQATTVSIDSADRTSIGLFAESDAELAPRLRVSGGLRVDAVRNTNAGGFSATAPCRTRRWPGCSR